MKEKLLATAGILIAIMLTAGCIGTSSGPPPQGKLTVIDHEITGVASGNVAVELTVKNTGTVMVELAQVTVSFYDAQKNLIDSTSDSVMSLGPGETWDFEIKCPGARCSQVKSYDIETVAGTSSGGP